MFAALVPAVLIGAAAERGRILPACIFFFCWSTLVYCPVVHWIWAPEGWAFKLGVLDYAGGGPIEICSGVTGLVYSIFLGKRRGFGTHILSFKPHNTTFVIQGTIFLWCVSRSRSFWGTGARSRARTRCTCRKPSLHSSSPAGSDGVRLSPPRRRRRRDALDSDPSLTFSLARSLAGGFNGGSAFAANVKAAVAITNTNLSAGFGGLAWMLMDYRLERKWSAVGYCTGAICGLVAITPAAGYVGYGCVGSPSLERATLVSVRRADERARTFLARSPSIFIGVVSAAISNLLTTLKGFFAFDDAMDIYACRASLSCTRALAREHR